MAIDPEDLAMLADLECPDCGPLVDEEGETWVSQPDVDTVFVDDRCPDCGAELEPTLDAALGMLTLIAERMPEQREVIAERIAEVLGSAEEGA